MRFALKRTKHIPKQLEPGILYVSEEFEFAAHLCACGCGSRIRTPLGPTEWEFKDTPEGPSLFPSVGNWQQKCKSHYWITQGQIQWDAKWSDEEILAGRNQEQFRREQYFEELYQKRRPRKSLWKRIKDFLGF